ncbi:MAG TPA: oligosaccharide flippase family protein [Stellaceae bacterium]|nr:oligosaccharide flippase family protein [Stellaceae bacterium]
MSDSGISTETAARSLFWTAIESGGLCGLSFVTLVLLSHVLTPEEFGIGAMALSVVQVLNLPVEMLFHDALVQREHVEERHYDTAFCVSVCLGILLSASCWVVAAPLARAIGEPDAGPVLGWMSLSLPISGLGCTIMARLRREMQFRPLAIRSLLGRVGGAIGAIAVAAGGGGVWSLVVQQVALLAISVAAVWIFAQQRPRLRLDWRACADLLGFGLRAITVLGVLVAYQRVFLLLAGTLLGAAAAGYLNLAFRTVDMLRDLLASAVQQLVLPIFARLQNERGRLATAYAYAVELTGAVSFPIFLGLFATAPEFIPILFGASWQPAVPFVQVVALAALPFFCRMFSAPVMTAIGAPQAALASAGLGLAIIVVGMLTFGRYSEQAAAAVWVGRLAFALPVDVLVLWRYGGIGLGPQFRGISRLLLLGAAMVAAVAATDSLLTPLLPAAIARLPVLVLTGAVTYVALMWLLNRELCERLLGFLRMAVRAERSAIRAVVADA